MIIELKAHISEDGKITFQTPVDLPSGEVDVVITYTTDEEAQDEALWEAQFAATPRAVFKKLVEKARADYREGRTDIFDPNSEDD
jgi:hypothetical protein